MAWNCIDCGNKWTDNAFASIPGFVCYYCGTRRGSEWLSAVKKLIHQNQKLSNVSKLMHDTGLAAIRKIG